MQLWVLFFHIWIIIMCYCSGLTNEYEMFQKLISRLFNRSTVAPKQADAAARKTPEELTSIKVNQPEINIERPPASDLPDIPVPERSIKVSIASFNRIEFLFYDFLLGPSVTSSTLNPIEQYILTRVNYALKNPQAVLTHFPVMPQSVFTLTNLLNDADFNLHEFIAVVEKEPSIASELMKKANSPAYKRGNNEITDLRQAFMLIGASDIKDFVLNKFVKNLCHQKPIYFRAFGEKIWLHSQEVASIARSLAKQRNQDADGAYIIGLMHDLGKIVIFQFMVEAFQKAHPDFKQDSLVFKKFLSEKSMLLSVELMKIWAMPSLIVDVVKQQTCKISNLSDLEPLAATLYEANLISEISLTYQAGNFEDFELDEMLANTLLRDDAQQFLRDSLVINNEPLVKVESR